MKTMVMALGGLAVAGAAQAGDIERSQQSVGILFEEGRYAELSFGWITPEVSGRALGAGSGNMTEDFGVWSLGYKQALAPNVDVAFIVDQPIGADIDYPTGTGYVLQGTNAELRSTALTALLRYRFDNDVSLIGGLRAEKVRGEAQILVTPPGINYQLEADGDWELGYVLGVAWEKPEIAARVALTYNSAIDHKLSTTESLGGVAVGDQSFETTVPQSVTLEAQTGIARDTLLFGSIRWVDWTEFQIAPAVYVDGVGPFPGFGEPIVFYDSDRITYTLGLGRKFNENWSGAITASYEPSTGDDSGNLGPTDGFKSIGVGATYTRDRFEVTGGIRYIRVGDARTRNIFADFEDNDALAVGFRVGYKF